jgi:hypothetical protein
MPKRYFSHLDVHFGCSSVATTLYQLKINDTPPPPFPAAAADNLGYLG